MGVLRWHAAGFGGEAPTRLGAVALQPLVKGQRVVVEDPGR